MRLKKIASAILLSTTLVFACGGCGTAGRHTTIGELTPGPVLVSMPHNPTRIEARYLPDLSSVLKQSGYAVAAEGEDAPCLLVFDVSHNWLYVHVTLFLRCGGELVAGASSFNFGMGTLIAHAAAVDDRINAAFDRFADELASTPRAIQAASRRQREPEKDATAVRLQEIQRLKHNGVITEEEYQALRQKILGEI